MDFFATGGFQQLYSDLEEEPLAGGDALLNIVSVGEFDSTYVDTSFSGGNYNQLEFEESDYYGIITLDSNNNTNTNGNIQVGLPHVEDPSLFIDFNDLTVCPPDLSDWEQRLLDNYVEIPDLVDFLPERTPCARITVRTFWRRATAICGCRGHHIQRFSFPIDRLPRPAAVIPPVQLKLLPHLLPSR